MLHSGIKSSKAKYETNEGHGNYGNIRNPNSIKYLYCDET
jgi:hypothetical protein